MIGKTMRCVLGLLLLITHQAHAFDAPPGQVRLTDRDILRGHFSQTHDGLSPDGPPPAISGHFVVVPSRGLIWGIEQPFPTETIITPSGMKQNFGGLMVKMPARNLRHIYDMVGGALRGDWNALGQDFTMVVSGTDKHWSVAMTPKPNTNLQFRSILVTGAKFLQGIAVTSASGVSDRFEFTDESLSPAPPAAPEQALLDKAN